MWALCRQKCRCQTTHVKFANVARYDCQLSVLRLKITLTSFYQK